MVHCERRISWVRYNKSVSKSHFSITGMVRCGNCGETTHKTWECPNEANVTIKTVCTLCGAMGHIAKDCMNPRPGTGPGSEFGAYLTPSGQLDEAVCLFFCCIFVIL